MEAGCALVAALRNDNVLAAPMLNHIAIATGARLIPSNGFIVAEMSGQGTLQCYMTTLDHLTIDSRIKGMSGMVTTCYTRCLETLHDNKTARQRSHQAVCGSNNIPIQIRNYCPLSAYAMALVAQPGLKGDAHGFWMHPSAAEAAQQLLTCVHQDPLQAAVSRQCKDTTEITSLSIRQASYLTVANIGIKFSDLGQAGNTKSRSFTILVHT